ncbi:MAG: dihydroorotate dehydrogenase electron transfer subunit [Solirubrobacterales bacterium]
MLKYSKEKIFDNIKINDTIYNIVLRGEFSGTPGQFYMLRSWNNEPLLSRPISIHNIDSNSIEFMYQVVGEGTRALSRLKPGDELEITGPLGNGFDIDNIKGKVAVIAGGIGTAPMQAVIKSLKNCEIDAYYGFRDKVFCTDEIKDTVNQLNISTEDGSTGHKGYITEIFNPEKYDVVLCCGPEVMMNKVIDMCREKNVKVYVTLETHMACGVGACLVCTCKTKDGNKRTCKEGPVFNGFDLL